ncbi:MAG: bifunctional DNA-formamidopyrimidine glycosylase/DNA-(apurinic or apyrimidinic site) lyase [Hyphomicrobium sp.]|nr:bifunctional DNA-formamidopyrimidine glycosylase/DNA-(apurinic or apyrimidinic site) lyase [Hyphomicrobium sp.]
MPELPEVENVRRTLIPAVVGARIERVELRRGDLRFPFPDRFAERLEGRCIREIGRRAKYLLWRLEGGEVLIVHLGMSGRVILSSSSDAQSSLDQRGAVVGRYVYEAGDLPQHDHVVMRLSNGATVTYNDPRRFGFMLLTDDDGLDRHPLFRHLGVEPTGTDLDAAELARRAHGRRTDLKAFLSDQRQVAGLGNIYVAEALFRAGLSPMRKAGTLARRDGGPTERAERLVAAIRAIIHEAIEAGGSTLRDFVRADGSRGDFQSAHAVYDRAGATCVRPGCGGVVRRRVQSNRSTFYCPKCQR